MALTSTHPNHLAEVFLVFLISILVLIIVLGIVRYSSLYHITQAVIATIVNSNYCPKTTTNSLCLLQPDMHLVVPNNSTTYSPQIAQFNCNLVACLEFAFLKITPGTTYIQESNGELNPIVHVPSGIIIRQEIYYKNKLIGMICTSTIHRSIWVVFRGTNGVNEWQEDLMIQQVSSPVFDGLIHKGFLEIYMTIRLSLLEGLLKLGKEGNYTSLYIGGHSLGGTCCQLLLADPLLVKSLPNNVNNKQVFLFGTPRLGNQIFCDAQTGQQIYRFQNQTDLVTQLPPPVSPNFIGNKNEVFLYTNNQTMIIEFYNQRSSYEENHSLKTYLYYLSSLVA